MVEVDVELRGTRRTSRRMRWWRRTKRHGSRRDTGGVKGEGREKERERERRKRTKKKKRKKKKKRTKKKRMKKKKKGADPAAIYTRSGADRGKTPQKGRTRWNTARRENEVPEQPPIASRLPPSVTFSAVTPTAASIAAKIKEAAKTKERCGYLTKQIVVSSWG
ncbi:Uncharacterized protein DBV15_07099 [Temnothorax longispinosus]|uniref:Uncharacterized protein n=1 Tax=Temnothorax longispinosus TaxID=300112 RepID=A0A4S2KRW2_9HYME|nr:Uncharacterized protein DBV15_07099 [Temnothorax longispinosus]